MTWLCISRHLEGPFQCKQDVGRAIGLCRLLHLADQFALKIAVLTDIVYEINDGQSQKIILLF